MFEVLDTVCQPTRATKYSAMVDLYARDDVIIGAGETRIIPLGVKILPKQLLEFWIAGEAIANNRIFSEEQEQEIVYNFLKSHYLELHPRSSLRAKGLIIGVGVIDLDYPDEIGLIVHNPITNSWNENFEDGSVDYITHLHNGAGGTQEYTIKKGDKVAQCTLKEHKGYLLGIESNAERTGGFGSSGK